LQVIFLSLQYEIAPELNILYKYIFNKMKKTKFSLIALTLPEEIRTIEIKIK